jgi:hypothetical protein
LYGYDFSKPDQGNSGSKKSKGSNQPVSASPIMGEAFLAVLRKVKPKLKWEEQHAEHEIKYKVRDDMVSVMQPAQHATYAVKCIGSYQAGVCRLAVRLQHAHHFCHHGAVPAAGCKDMMTHLLCCAMLCCAALC